MKNYHTQDTVEMKKDLIYVNGKLVGCVDEHETYWNMVIKEQNNRLLESINVFNDNCLYNHEEKELIEKAMVLVSKYC